MGFDRGVEEKKVKEGDWVVERIVLTLWCLSKGQNL